MKLKKLRGDFDAFNSELFPSITLVSSPDPSEIGIYIVHAGIEWNSWLVTCTLVVGYKCEDESYAPTSEWTSATRDSEPCGFYECFESQWLNEWSGYPGQEVVESRLGKLRHFAFLGGDLNIDVLCYSEPSVKRNTLTTITKTIQLPKLSDKEVLEMKQQIALQEEISKLSYNEMVERLKAIKFPGTE